MNTHRESSTITNAACVTLQVSSTCITADLFSSANVQSATAKLTAKIKQQTIIDNTNVDALMGLHKCERKNCPNHDKNGWCFDADRIHLKLNNVHLRSWNMAINEEEAPLDSPPSTLPVNLMPTRASEANPYRKREKSPPQPPAPNPMNLSATTPH